MATKNHLIKEVAGTPNFPELEQELLKKWYEEGIEEEYLHKNDDSDKKYSFFDGPITANNPMGVHHAWGRTYKDIWQRFKNMQGYQQRFQNGFDCQGLWVEVEVEKELGFKTKKDIETYGVDKFVEKCKERVIKYSSVQTDQSKRLGYFMDWDNSYFTMSDENNYMIWHLLKTCWKKGWIYKGHESVPWCPRCETAISQHEMLTEDYKELTHKSIVFELPLVGKDDEFLLVWTTTPWTIPANVAVAVNKDMEYSLIEGNEGHKFWIAKDRVDAILRGEYKQIIKTVKGSELVGLNYLAPFDDLPLVKKIKDDTPPDRFHVVLATDDLIMPVSAEEGTGLVHTAPSAGTEDFMLGRKYNLPLIPIIADNADYLDNLGFLSGQNAKKHPEVILDNLTTRTEAGENWVFRIENYTHRYPACWRCKTELVWKVADEWYIAMDKQDPDDKDHRTLREKMIEVAKKISWIPKFGLERELDWLNNMHDWLISKKNRYWGLALPLWVCDKCGEFEVIGSKEELKERAVKGWDKFEGHTPHRPFIDEVKLTCSCGGEMTRITDVGNPWLDAGIIPYSTLVDPATGKVSYLSDKKYWEEWFPAQFITESFPGQFKNWFYSLIAQSTILEDTNPFENVLGFASVIGEDGRPMHKSWGNSIEFNEAASAVGVDSMRWVYSRHSPERNLMFGFNVINEVKRQFYMMLWNSYRYFVNYAALDNWEAKDSLPKLTLLDEWVLSRLSQVVKIATDSLERYDAFTATAEIESFVNDLSTWYIRRSRDRVGPSALDVTDKEAAYSTLSLVFDVLSRLLMPFTPFIADEMYTNVTGNRSVNLADWPTVEELQPTNEKLITSMDQVRKIAELGNAERKKLNIAIKQPLASLEVIGDFQSLTDQPELIQLIKDELNVLEVTFKSGATPSVVFDTNLTDELIRRGQVRELIRSIQQARKDAGTRLDERVDVVLPDWPVEFEADIKKKTLVRNLLKGDSVEVRKIS